MTGMAAAELMVTGEVGILRTVPPADPGRLARFRRTAEALGVPWPKEMPYPEFVRALDANVPRQAALLAQAAGLLRGSGYTSFDRDAPAHAEHAALASTYAHTTAPLRRLVDRYVGETCVALSEDRRVPDWVASALPSLPELMEVSDRRAGQYEAGIVSTLEAAILERHVGETFEAVVVDIDRDGAAGTVQLRDPAVTARCDGPRPPARGVGDGASRAGGRPPPPGALRPRLSPSGCRHLSPSGNRCSLPARWASTTGFSRCTSSRPSRSSARGDLLDHDRLALGHGQHGPGRLADARLAGGDGAGLRRLPRHDRLRRVARHLARRLRALGRLGDRGDHPLGDRGRARTAWRPAVRRGGHGGPAPRAGRDGDEPGRRRDVSVRRARSSSTR